MAFWFAVSFGGENGLRKVGLGGIHPLTQRYVLLGCYLQGTKMMAKAWFSKFDETIFSRSYLVTIGGLCVSLPVLALILIGSIEWVGLTIALLTLFLGLCCIGIGFCSSSKRAIEWADACSKHEASILIMFLAIPLYYAWINIRSLLART
ncbi:hypothetical protein OC523_006640 [Vibrio vulnificus]